jgi:hypothetical protein
MGKKLAGCRGGGSLMPDGIPGGGMPGIGMPGCQPIGGGGMYARPLGGKFGGRVIFDG